MTGKKAMRRLPTPVFRHASESWHLGPLRVTARDPSLRWVTMKPSIHSALANDIIAEESHAQMLRKIIFPVSSIPSRKIRHKLRPLPPPSPKKISALRLFK